jgi:hypothetical protein
MLFWGTGKQSSSAATDSKSSAIRDKTKLDLSQVKNEQDRKLLSKLDEEFISSVITDLSSGFVMAFEKSIHVTTINYFLYYFFPQSINSSSGGGGGNTREETSVDAPDRFTSPFTINVTKLILLLQSNSFRSIITGIRTNSKGIEITVTRSPESSISSSGNTRSRISSDREVKERSDSSSDFNALTNTTEFRTSRRSINGQRPSGTYNRDRDEPEETIDDEVYSRKRKRARIAVSDDDTENTLQESKPFNLTARSRDILAGRLSLGDKRY